MGKGKTFLRNGITDVILIIFVAVASLWVIFQPLGTYLEEETFSYLSKPSSNHDAQVTIIAIDDKTLSKLDISPRREFPITYLTQALARLKEMSPKLVILDSPLPEQQQTLDGIEEFNKELSTLPSVVSSDMIQASETDSHSNPPFPQAPGFRDSAKSLLPMTIPTDGDRVKAIGASAQVSHLVKTLASVAKVQVIPPSPRAIINKSSRPNSIKTISFADFISDSPEQVQSLVKDKIVLIGFASQWRKRGFAGSYRFSVFGESDRLFGIDVHALMVANLLSNSTLTPFSEFGQTILILLIVTLTPAMMLSSRTRIKLSFFAASLPICTIGMSVALNQLNLYLIPFLVAFIISTTFSWIAFIVSCRAYHDRCKLVLDVILAQKQIEKRTIQIPLHTQKQ